MKKRIMIVGFSDRKKADLAYALEFMFAFRLSDEAALSFVVHHELEAEGCLPGRQDARYGPNTLDVPAAYLENPWAYQHLIALAQNDAEVILFVVDPTQKNESGAPRLVQALCAPAIGVIIESDSVDLDPAKKLLSNLGIQTPYRFLNLESEQEIYELFLQAISLRDVVEKRKGGTQDEKHSETRG